MVLVMRLILMNDSSFSSFTRNPMKQINVFLICKDVELTYTTFNYINDNIKLPNELKTTYGIYIISKNTHY